MLVGTQTPKPYWIYNEHHERGTFRRRSRPSLVLRWTVAEILQRVMTRTSWCFQVVVPRTSVDPTSGPLKRIGCLKSTNYKLNFSMYPYCITLGRIGINNNISPHPPRFQLAK